VPEAPPSSPHQSPKPTRPPSLSLAENRRRPDMAVARSSLAVDVASVVVPAETREVAEARSRPVVAVVDSRVTAITTTAEVDPVLLAVVALAGRITTSLPETETPASTSRLTGSCSRRLTSTDWLSSTWRPMRVRTSRAMASFTTTTARSIRLLSSLAREDSLPWTAPHTT
jgi:hypothetical protein